MEYLKYSVEKLMEVNSNANVEECNFKDDLTECNITLKTLRSDNVNKLTFAHLNISSIRNKFELLFKLISFITKREKPPVEECNCK